MTGQDDMDEREIERILGRYRPAGPPDDLRGRALATDLSVRTWPWLSVAAALLALTIGFQAASRGHGAGAPLPPSLDERAVVRAELVSALGGGELAEARAEILMAAQEALRQDAPAPPVPADQESR